MNTTGSKHDSACSVTGNDLQIDYRDLYTIPDTSTVISSDGTVFKKTDIHSI